MRNSITNIIHVHNTNTSTADDNLLNCDEKSTTNLLPIIHHFEESDGQASRSRLHLVNSKQEFDGTGSKSKRKNENGSESIIAKRIKQKEATQKSRIKKANQIQQLENKCLQLEKDNFELTLQISTLQLEKSSWITQREKLENIIKYLRTQMEDYHMLLKK